MSILKRIGVRSSAKLAAIMYALMGLIVGAIMMVFALSGISLGEGTEGPNLLFGVGAIFFMPIFYGIAGYIAGALATGIFNMVAGWTGGLEIEIEMSQVPQSPQVGSEPLSQ